MILFHNCILLGTEGVDDIISVIISLYRWLRACLVVLWLIEKLLWAVGCGKVVLSCELWESWKSFVWTAVASEKTLSASLTYERTTQVIHSPPHSTLSLCHWRLFVLPPGGGSRNRATELVPVTDLVTGDKARDWAEVAPSVKPRAEVLMTAVDGAREIRMAYRSRGRG